MKWIALAPLLALVVLANAVADDGSNADLIDPKIGTENGGNALIGPSLPFGMIKPGPDTGDNKHNSGWGPGGDINGFSQTHVSGTGGGAKYGNVLIQPTVGPVDIRDFGSPRKDEEASAGYYGVTLSRYGIRAEITTAAKAAIYRFTFPESDQAQIIFDAGHCLSSSVGAHEDQSVTGSVVQVVSPGEVVGSTSVTGGWNKQPNSYTVYFCALCDTPAVSSGTWAAGALHPDRAKAVGGPKGAGAWLNFRTRAGQQVLVKIGISFVSIERARAHVRGQILDFGFDAVRAGAVKAWDDALAPIRIVGGTADQRRMFYSSVYHAMLMPSDRTGDNPLWQSSEPYYDDFYTIWDTFRSSSPLLTLVAQDRQVDIVRALVDIQRHEGYLPDGRSGNFNGRTQGGSNADTLIADAYVKGLPGINWEDAYAAVAKDAEVPPDDQFKEGRGGLADWKTLGYCSIEGVDRSGNKTLEYAHNDFGLALMARGLGKAAEAAKYLARSRHWVNLWDPGFEDGGFSGFIRTRHRDGSWKEKFTALDQCSWNGDTFYEGNSWTYSFFAPHDMATLIARCGGAETFTRRLDAFFDVKGRCDVSDEPFFLTPYLYIWSGHQEKTAERLHRILTDDYHPTPGGLPGNDDSGAMGSWYAFGALGFFPNAGQDIYLIGTPLFPQASLKLANGRTFTIRAEGGSDRAIYIESATLNGLPFDTAWIRHSTLTKGGTLVLKMSDTPSHWPSGPVPPSPASEPAGP
jgi:predicted alpha-1,2-mannosidase